ncbi:MAG: hypothetical protein LBV27_03355 [Oscillospiraceae bacterium]|nr:hypothetical protein [Oscillospiraceae bacterium]
MLEQHMKHPALRLLVVIVDKADARKITGILDGMHVHACYQCNAEGTANSDVLDVLGLGSSDKVVTICVAPQVITTRLLEESARKLRMMKPGQGIVFTVPISGVGHAMLKLLSDEAREMLMNRLESEVNKVKNEATHDLILAVINQGYSEDLMEAAKSAGATGGTVIHARRAGEDAPAKFWGISIQEEKEVVAILAEHTRKVEIMKAISAKCGMTSEAQGFVIAVPVDDVAGL